MNLAIHGLSGDVKLGDSLLDDKFAGARADFVLANPPLQHEALGRRLGREGRALDRIVAVLAHAEDA